MQEAEGKKSEREGEIVGLESGPFLVECVCVSSSHSMENEISESHTLSQAAALGISLLWARWREEREREKGDERSGR